MGRPKLHEVILTRWLLSLSLIAFGVRAVQYLLIGSVFPAAFLLCILFVLVASAALSIKALHRTIRLWGGFLVLYGLLRFGVSMTVWLGVLDSANVIDAITVGFCVLTAFYFGAGVTFLRRPDLGIAQRSVVVSSS